MKSLLVLALIGILSTVHCDEKIVERIINGHDAEYKDYVTMVSGYNGEYGTFGGGSFISDRHVLTAGGLIYNMSWWFVDFGSVTLGGMPSQHVSSALLHPGYDPMSFANDIGILYLSNNVDPIFITPIPLPTVPNTPYVNEQGRVAGFGMYQSGTDWLMNQHKQVAYFRRILDSECEQLLAQNELALSGNSFCAIDLDYGASICYGDMGSGMSIYIDEVNTLVGIVSVFTNMCHRDYPAVFTKVAPYVDWIKENISE